MSDARKSNSPPERVLKFLERLPARMCSALSVLASVNGLAADDVVIAAFESGNYQEWAITADALGEAPANGALPNQLAVSGFRGSRLADISTR